MKEPSFSFNDFCKWMGKQPGISFINENGLSPGDQVLIRLSEKNMISKLRELNEDCNYLEFKEICSCLRENGGTLKEIRGANAKIRVSGCDKEIFVQRLFLRRPKK